MLNCFPINIKLLWREAVKCRGGCLRLEFCGFVIENVRLAMKLPVFPRAEIQSLVSKFIVIKIYPAFRNSFSSWSNLNFHLIYIFLRVRSITP